MIEFIGSYTDPKYIELIISSIIEIDLSTYLTRADTAKHRELRIFFSCLARALEFLYKQKVRHKNIKPRNILVYNKNILFTDFGLLFNFIDTDSSTTINMVNRITPKYYTPKVAAFKPRNTTSDI